jgi:tetratricopeptide (TPR) repeat protein
MEKNRFRMLIPTSFIIIGLIMGYPTETARAQDRCEKWAAKMVSMKGGGVQVRRAGETAWASAKLNETYCPGDTVRTLENSRAVLLLPNENYSRLAQDTTGTFNGIEKEKISLLGLIKGAFHFFSRTPRSLKVTTPFVNGTVEGTEFLVKAAPDHTLISVFQGNVLAANDIGSLNLASGQSAIAYAGEAPKAHIVVRPRDALQWAIYYPAVIDYRPTDFPGEEAWQGMVRKSIQHYRDGDLAAAFSSLEGVPETIPDPRFYTYRAGLLLTVGRVDKASDDIEKSLETDPENSQAFTLRSIIAVAQNRKDEALEVASRAVALDPDSSAAKVALSYAYQANFQIQAALEILQEAVALSPENALAWARLSELWMSVGDLDKALEAAQKGADLNPNLARTQTVLGFAYLAQIKTQDAKAAFEKAIALDQAAPLPRLGLGLAKIREGDLEPGRGDIEIAVSLDPNNSLMRSYLGKAFFDEKRDRHSDNQLALAKELDPKDPTPWFYDAIRKQTLNRPVEALRDLQKSIELNDNHAVYRSRLGLDQDLAARSASLGRIYSDLGFQQLALVEGWKSVNADPSNYSAHRFLADSYAALPRHEIARVSELLQSQLLQPININPIQPSLAESNLFIPEGAGPSDPSFQEFNPLFNRNRLALQASGVYGNNDTIGGEIVQSGVLGKVSYSVGGFKYKSDGFRENNDLKQDIYNVFTQISLSHKTSVQAEFRYKDVEKGDLELRFNPDDFRSGFRRNLKTESLRLGFRHSFIQGSNIIGSVIFDRLEFTDIITDISPPFDFRRQDDLEGKTKSFELQYLHNSSSYNSIIGAGYLRTDNDRTELTEMRFIPPIPIEPDIDSVDSKNKIQHRNVYLYTHIPFPKKVIWTIGASVDFFKDKAGGYKKNDQFNPKLGLIWNPVPATTLRAAAFRALRRTLTSTNQTLEPTQVAGFNQFFDDPSGASSWRYGIALDQKIFEKVYGGLEYSRRGFDENVKISGSPPQFKEVDREERMGRAYLYCIPHSWFLFKAEYMYEKQDRGKEYNDGVEVVRTNKFPLGVNFFHPSGLSTGLMATYFEQEGMFQRQGTLYLPAEFGSDHFWVIDATIRYRLPKRLGIFSITVKNLFDEFFKYQDTDPSRPELQPERSINFKFTLSF